MLAYEAAGTGLIVFFGCAPIAASKYLASTLTLGGVAACWGAGVTLAVYATRDVSGAHLNPAVTAALAVHRPGAQPLAVSAAYAVAQVAGAAAGSLATYLTFSTALGLKEAAAGAKRGAAGSEALLGGAFAVAPGAGALRGARGAYGVEMIATGVLSFLIFALTDPESTVPPAAAPALIGATVAGLVAAVGPVSGAGMNPARDLGPRLIAAAAGWGGRALKGWAPFTLGPLMGAVLGGGVHDAMKAL
jgi:glycerol uptake facilitator protein